MSFSVLVATVAIGAPTLKDRPATIVGEWVCEERLIAGKPDPHLRTQPFSLRLTEKRWIGFSPRGVAMESTMIVDAKANPPTLTLFDKDDAEGSGKVGLSGIFKIEGDTLTICYVLDNGTRPKEFESKPGTDVRLLTLRRIKEK